MSETESKLRNMHFLSWLLLTMMGGSITLTPEEISTFSAQVDMRHPPRIEYLQDDMGRIHVRITDDE